MKCLFKVTSGGLCLSVAGIPGFAIEGPSQAKIECEDQNDGSCDVKYWPTEPGEYAVHVMCDDEDIEDSPFMALIGPNGDGWTPHRVRTAALISLVHLSVGVRAPKAPL